MPKLYPVSKQAAPFRSEPCRVIAIRVQGSGENPAPFGQGDLAHEKVSYTHE